MANILCQKAEDCFVYKCWTDPGSKKNKRLDVIGKDKHKRYYCIALNHLPYDVPKSRRTEVTQEAKNSLIKRVRTSTLNLTCSVLELLNNSIIPKEKLK